MDFLGPELRDGLLGAAVEGTGGIRYHLRSLLGEGGQGWVYRANYDDPDGFWIVVKVLRPEGVQSDALRRFEREAEVLRMLGAVPAPNPNIVRFYDYGVHPIPTPEGEVPLPFLALEYVEGQTLGGVLAHAGGFGLPVERVRRLMKQVARALHTVHERQIVHRDLKPSNILLAEIQGQEVAKVTDFGLVKLPQLAAHSTATVAGASMGYAPPEQYEMGNNRVSVQTDVFSFATILFEALAGTEAFPFKPGDNPLRIVARMLSGDRPSLVRSAATVSRELRERPELMAELDKEIARAITPDPGARHGSIRELWERVEPVLRSAELESSARSRQNVLSTPLSSAVRGPGFDEAAGRETAHSSPTSHAVAGSRPSGPGRANVADRVSAPAVSAPAAQWRMVGRAMPGERLRAAVFAPDRSIVAAGTHGLYLFSHGVWSSLHTPQGVDARAIRGLVRLQSGELIVHGEGSLAAILSPSGGVERLGLRDRNLSLTGVHVDCSADGVAQRITLVGERSSGQGGILVDACRGAEVTVLDIEGVACLHDVTRLGESLIACGLHGALLEIPNGAEPRGISWARTGHLYAVTAGGEGGFVVGSGGHALRLTRRTGAGPSFAATLEAVQTTRDLTHVAVDAEGCGWAVGADARLLLRKNAVWMRLPLPASSDGVLILIGPRADGTLVLAADGTVLEGRDLA